MMNKNSNNPRRDKAEAGTMIIFSSVVLLSSSVIITAAAAPASPPSSSACHHHHRHHALMKGSTSAAFAISSPCRRQRPVWPRSSRIILLPSSMPLHELPIINNQRKYHLSRLLSQIQHDDNEFVATTATATTTDTTTSTYEDEDYGDDDNDDQGSSIAVLEKRSDKNDDQNDDENADGDGDDDERKRMRKKRMLTLLRRNRLNDLGGNISTSIFLLNVVAIIWGTQHSIIKTVVDDSDAAIFTFLRFSLAASLATIPILLSSLASSSSETTTGTAASSVDTNGDSESSLQQDDVWRWGLEMGLWMFAGFSFQAIGLLSTTAQRSGFLLYLNVKFVPLFAKLLYGRYISPLTWISAIAAFTGTAMLALDGESSVRFNVGDVWSILAAAASAMFILRLETASVKVKNATKLNASSLTVVAVLSFIWMLLQIPPDMSQVDVGATTLVELLPTADSLKDKLSETQSIIQNHPWALLYLGGVSTALSNFIQTKAQKNISAERASIIYSLDPVYGGIFAWFWLGENLGGLQSIAGAALITVAAATNAFLDLNNKSTTTKED